MIARPPNPGYSIFPFVSNAAFRATRENSFTFHWLSVDLSSIFVDALVYFYYFYSVLCKKWPSFTSLIECIKSHLLVKMNGTVIPPRWMGNERVDWRGEDVRTGWYVRHKVKSTRISIRTE